MRDYHNLSYTDCTPRNRPCVAAPGLRPGAKRREYKNHMSVSNTTESTLRRLFNQYRNSLRANTSALNSSFLSYAPTPQPPAAAPTSIQIFINKEDLRASTSSRPLDPSVTVLNISSDNRTSVRGSSHQATPSRGDAFLNIGDPHEVSPPAGVIRTKVLGVPEIHLSNASISPDTTLSPEKEVGRLYKPPKVHDTTPPPRDEVERFSCDEKEEERFSPGGNEEVERFSPPPLFQDQENPRAIVSRLRQISLGEFAPEQLRFHDLTQGMSCLRQQVYKLCDDDDDAKGRERSNSPLYSRKRSEQQRSPSPIETPRNSSPAHSPTIPETVAELSHHLLNRETEDISPIKETRPDTDQDMSSPLQRTCPETDQDPSSPLQRTRRASIADTLSKFQGKGMIPANQRGVLRDIMGLLDLEVDIGGVLEYLETRVEINLDRLEQGDTVVNALAGIESDLEFKILQVEALKRATEQDEAELEAMRDILPESVKLETMRDILPEAVKLGHHPGLVVVQQGRKEDQGHSSPLPVIQEPTSSTSMVEKSATAPKPAPMEERVRERRRKLAERIQEKRRTREVTEPPKRTRSEERLNTQLYHSLRDISKSPLHFEDEGSDSTIADHITEPERSDPEPSSSRDHNVDHHTSSSQAVTEPSQFTRVEPSSQIKRSPFEPSSQIITRSPVAILPKCSLPREELVSFVQQHLSDADSRGVLQAVLFPKQEEGEEDTESLSLSLTLSFLSLTHSLSQLLHFLLPSLMFLVLSFGVKWALFFNLQQMFEQIVRTSQFQQETLRHMNNSSTVFSLCHTRGILNVV
eukprot:sb/3462184/